MAYSMPQFGVGPEDRNLARTAGSPLTSSSCLSVYCTPGLIPAPSWAGKDLSLKESAGKSPWRGVTWMKISTSGTPTGSPLFPFCNCTHLPSGVVECQSGGWRKEKPCCSSRQVFQLDISGVTTMPKTAMRVRPPNANRLVIETREGRSTLLISLLFWLYLDE